jgi:hypothetical protein
VNHKVGKLAILLLAALAICQVASAANIAIPVTGTGPNAVAFTGTFSPTSFVLQNGQVLAQGILSGTVTKGGQTVGGITSNVSMPLAAATTGSCDILHLVLGPLDLNLLGLQVHLNQVVLDITAQSGPGNLLGNLLCTVANLLNNPSQTLVDLLNQILTILRGL